MILPAYRGSPAHRWPVGPAHARAAAMTAEPTENTTPPGNDSALIEKIPSGDPAAFMKFYDRFAPLLFSVAARVLSDRKEAEDVLQEVMLAIWKKSGEYD